MDAPDRTGKQATGPLQGFRGRDPLEPGGDRMNIIPEEHILDLMPEKEEISLDQLVYLVELSCGRCCHHPRRCPTCGRCRIYPLDDMRHLIAETISRSARMVTTKAGGRRK